MNFSRPLAGLMFLPLLAGLVFTPGAPAQAVVQVAPTPVKSEPEEEAVAPEIAEESAPPLSPEAAAPQPQVVEGSSPRPPEAEALPPLLDELLQQDLGGVLAGAPEGPQAQSAQSKSLWPGTVYDGNFADPFVLPVAENGGTVYYAYATNSDFRSLPMLRSTDLKTWTVAHYTSDPGWADRNWVNDYNPMSDNAIPTEIREFSYQSPDLFEDERNRAIWLNVDGFVSRPPTWARPITRADDDFSGYRWNTHESWAPAVAKLGNTYYAYTSVRARGAKDKFCIAVASSQSPAGPYRASTSSKPVVCPSDRLNGVIDPEPFQYKGAWYLLWKSENSPGKEQGLHAQRLDPATGRLMAKTKPVDLLLRDANANAWEHHAIENPSMATIGGTTYLFYSSGRFWAQGDASSQYSTDYAVCPKGPTAPCTRAEVDNRLLASVGSIQGPGGGSAFQAADGSWKFAYHAYQLNGSPGERQLRIANIYRWPSGAVAIADGSKPRFADVPKHQQFYNHIMWLAGQGITTGDKNGNFRPLGSTSRADMAAFLYRYAGSPNYTPKGHEPFADVTKRTKFYKEIRWMHAQGLSTGVRDPKGGKPSYVSNAAITREAMAAFFYRLSDTRGYVPKGKEPLVDVNRKSKFYREIRWMYDHKITTGINIGGGKYRFNEYSQTNRDAFAAFLLRYDEQFGK